MTSDVIADQHAVTRAPPPGRITRPGAIGDVGIYQSLGLKGFWLWVEWLWQTPLPPVLSILKELGVL
jgi:hypothetical protein